MKETVIKPAETKEGGCGFPTARTDASGSRGDGEFFPSFWGDAREEKDQDHARPWGEEGGENWRGP